MKRLLILLLASVIAAGSLLAASVSAGEDNTLSSADTEEIKLEYTFTDVEPGSELDAALIKLKNAGILNGYEDGSFRAENGLTRAEFCKMINKLFGYTEKAEDNFSDVTEDDWFFTEVQVAKKQGYIQGFEDSTVRGREQITREQVCVILDRINNFYKLFPVEISDPVSDWSRESVEAVISNGFMKLEEGNTFRAKEIITRAEFAYVFVPFVDAMQEDKDDNEDDTGTGTGTETGTGTGTTQDDDDDEEETGSENPGGEEGTGEENPEVDLTEDDIVIEEMEKLYADLDSRKRFTHPDEFKPFFESVKQVIKQIIDESETTLITPEYISENYKETMYEIRDSYYSLCDECIAEFNSIVNECATKYKAVLVEYFYDIIPEEAFEVIG